MVGIIPAAGKASRLGLLPFSKGLFPIGFQERMGAPSPKTVSSYLIDQMAEAGISNFHFVLRKGKWDIPAYYQGGLEFDKHFCYHIADYSYGVPFSLNQVYPFIKDKIVATGFPDILMKPDNVFKKLSEKLLENDNTSVTLGLFPSPDPLKWDMVEFDEEQRISRFFIKTEKGKQLKFTWAIAMWKPEFTVFLNHFIQEILVNNTVEQLLEKEYQLSEIFTSAMNKGMNFETVIFQDGKCMDIGSPERLVNAGNFFNTTT